jgi:PAS domain S-box-containing protein
MSKDNPRRREPRQDAAEVGKPKERDNCPVIVVGIGAPAGELESVRRLLAAVPRGRGVAFVLIQHPQPPHENLTAALLADHTALPVVEGADGMPVLADRVHVIPPGVFLNIGECRLTFLAPAHCERLRMPIDHFFCSLATDQRHRACGVLLSGTGSDGIMGLSEIKAAAGRTLAEAPVDGQVPSSLQSAIEAGTVDALMPTEALAGAIVAQAEQIIEETRKTYAAIRAERQRLYDVLETLPVYVVLLSEDYHVPFANRFFRERFGESHGKRCYEYLFNRTEACEICESYTVMKTKAPHRWEWTGPDGRDYDIYDFPFTDADGSRLIMEMGIDITEVKKAQAALQAMNETLEHRVAERTAALRESQKELQVILDSVPAIIFYKDKENRFIRTNKAFEDALGLPKEGLEGKSLFDLFPREQAEAYWRDDQEVIASGKEKVGIVEPMQTPQGMRVVRTDKVPSLDESGNVIGVIGFAVDITEQQRAEAEIQRHIAELQAANDELARFNRAAVDRELRMIELKKQVNELCAKAGLPARYPLDFGEESGDRSQESGDRSEKGQQTMGDGR